MKLKVFLNMYGCRQEVGLLHQDKQRIFFEYAPGFLKSGIELSPFKLPLKVGVFEEKAHVFDGLFGLFNDSLPDGWGCLLLDRKLRKLGKSYAEITPLDRLSLIGANPMGALEYEPADKESNLYGEVELDSLSGEVDRILDGEVVSSTPLAPTMSDNGGDALGDSWGKWENRQGLKAFISAGKHEVHLNFRDPERIGCSFNYFRLTPVAD